MIPYADLEQALRRWKAQQAGAEMSYVAPEHTSEVGSELGSEVASGEIATAADDGGVPAHMIEAETSSSSIEVGDADLDSTEKA